MAGPAAAAGSTAATAADAAADSSSSSSSAEGKEEKKGAGDEKAPVDSLYKPGDMILAKWKGKVRWYEAEIDKVNADGTYAGWLD